MISCQWTADNFAINYSIQPAASDAPKPLVQAYGVNIPFLFSLKTIKRIKGKFLLNLETGRYECDLGFMQARVNMELPLSHPWSNKVK